MAVAKQNLSLRGRTMLVPEMDRFTTMTMAAGVEGLLDATVRILPTGKDSDLSLGKAHSSGKECWPYVQTTADILTELKRLRENGDSLDGLLLLMPQANGPCRFGQYNTSQKSVLSENGFGEVKVVSPTTKDSYTLDGIITKAEAGALRKVVFNAMLFGDVLNRMVWRTRPYERESGLADKVGEDSLETICRLIKEGAKGRTGVFASYKEIHDEFRGIAEDFKAVIDPAIKRKPLVLVIGEIDLRSHTYSNHDTVRKLEELGCETVIASIAEWVNYTTYVKVYEEARKLRENFVLNRFSEKIDFQNVKQLLKYELTLLYQYVRMGKAYDAASALGIQRDHTIEHLFGNLGDWYHRDLVGEAVLSIASAITATKEGFDGVANVYPFGCMPSNNALTVLGSYYASLAEILRGMDFPHINIPCDDTNQPTILEDLALFADKANRHMKMRIGANGVSANAF